MQKEILIDASQQKQTRVAIKSDSGVEEYEYENEQKKQLKGNIYLGRVSRIEPSLQAAFVDFGNERHGFLAFNDIQTQYYQIPLSDKEAILREEEEVRKQLLEETKDLSPNEINNADGEENPEESIESSEDENEGEGEGEGKNSNEKNENEEQSEIASSDEFVNSESEYEKKN